MLTSFVFNFCVNTQHNAKQTKHSAQGDNADSWRLDLYSEWSVKIAGSTVVRITKITPKKLCFIEDSIKTVVDNVW